jgi:preprotein translocase subunit YajC
MHFKRLIVMLVVLLLIATIAPLLILRPWRQSSPEMSLLRQVEVRLNLPPSKDRTEDDRGTYHDDKNNTHNVRRITRYYDQAETAQQARIRLGQLGWGARQVTTIGGVHTYALVSNVDRACIQVQTNSDSSDVQANSITLLAASDDACSGYFNAVP